MKDKKAAEILIKIMDKYSLKGEEKEAIKNAIGVLSWTSLAESRIKSIKKRRDKQNKDLSTESE